MLDFLKRLGSLIADTFGSGCEVVLSDLDHPEAAILEIFNGSVTGRKVGDPLRADALERVSNSADGFYINAQNNRNGKMIKTSTISSNIGGRNIAFCINVDCTQLEALQHLLNGFLQTQDNSGGAADPAGAYAPVIETAIREGIQQVGKPVRLMNKKDRCQVIQYLEERGILKMQKSVQAIAQHLGISRYTVYNYLHDLRQPPPVESGQEDAHS